jgi:hypothetical protein
MRVRGVSNPVFNCGACYTNIFVGGRRIMRLAWLGWLGLVGFGTSGKVYES